MKVLLCWTVAGLMLAQQQAPQPALEGLDPVLLAQGKEEPGKSEYTAKHGRFHYVFASAANREQFLKDPDRWGIQLGGACARMGDPVGGSPDSYHVYDGRIYIFGSSECYTLFKENPTRYLATPVIWKPDAAALQRGSAMLAEVRAKLHLTGFTGWTEKRKTGQTERTLIAKLPFSIEAESTNPRFSFQEKVTREKVERIMQGRTMEIEGGAARATRAGYARDFLWLVSGSLEAVPSAKGADVFSGNEVVTLELQDNRPVAAEWKGRGAAGAIAQVRIVYGDFREAAGGGGMVPFRYNVSFDGVAAPDASWSLESLSIDKPKASAGWDQWGGPGRDFQVAAEVHAWPAAEGPKRIWRRKLGDGYSAIVSDGPTLYTMYRQNDEEVVLAASAASGATIWEHHYRAPMFEGFEDVQGPGPRATPLMDGGLLFTVGATGVMHCLHRDSGKPAWSLDLQKTFGARIRARGYSVSPVAWKDNVVVLAGGAGSSIVSLRKKDGGVVWKARDEEVAYASPFLMKAANGRVVLVSLMAREILGLDPDSGALLWSHPHLNSELVNASTPVAGEDGILFLSSAYDGGCRALQMSADGSSVKEIWAHRLMRIHHGNAVRIGGMVYGSSGDSGPSPLTALDIKTGKVLWRDRSLGKSSMLAVGGKRLLLLDDEGSLLLVEPAANAPTILAKAQLMAGRSWTVPTLLDGRLFIRNRAEMAAFELP